MLLRLLRHPPYPSGVWGRSGCESIDILGRRRCTFWAIISRTDDLGAVDGAPLHAKDLARDLISLWYDARPLFMKLPEWYPKYSSYPSAHFVLKTAGNICAKVRNYQIRVRFVSEVKSPST
jgi:hypothetical protein